MQKQKLHCYVDETGQDVGSNFFIVVAVVSDSDQEKLRDNLLQLETAAGTHGLKWHKSRFDRRINYLRMVLERKMAQGDVFFGIYQKPLPYFFPLLEILKKAIKRKTKERYRATVYVDGVDRKKAAELTNALRLQDIQLNLVKSRRDESEPIIRLADMWAGCIRAAIQRQGDERTLLEKALRTGHLQAITTQYPLTGAM